MIGWKWPVRGLTLGLTLVSGCATQPEEPNRDAALDSSEAKAEEPTAAAPEQSAVEADAVAEEESAARGLDEIERELAANNAKLRELGVTLAEPSTKQELAEPSEDGEAGGAIRKEAKKNAEKGAGKSTAPSRPKAKDDQADLDDPRAGPEPVKAAPLSPTDASRNQDLVGRCQQICDLSAISCELGDQICELADRHVQEQHYESACERAVGDCDAAKEACDACE